MRQFFSNYKILIILLGTCIVVYGSLQILSWWFLKNPNEFGDTAGWINGLFSAMAFAGVIYAIFMQRDELELQRQELNNTRQELAAQKEEFKTQNETMKRQRFENTFFNMLQLQQQITDNISYSFNETVENENWAPGFGEPYKTYLRECKGRDAFFLAFERADHKWENSMFRGMRGLIDAKGLEGYEDNFTPSYFDHYFRHLYRILKFIAESKLIKDDDRYEYAATVRTQLSRYELIWLYYNGLSCYGRDKFKPLIEQFAMLNNLREDMLASNVEMDISYNQNAFQHDEK